MNRRGIALIIAIVILTGLLLLGLPFLFTQSTSLNGTHSFVHGQVAHIGADSAENLGLGIASTALSHHLSAPAAGSAAEDWSSIYYDLNGGIDPEAHEIVGNPNRIGLNLTTTTTIPYNAPTNAQGTLLGTIIEDESGKFDPNHLDAISWSKLLTAVGIADQPGDLTAPSGYVGSGSLAQALAGLRYDNLLTDASSSDLQPPIWFSTSGVADPRANYQGGRIRTLEQLMQALPVGSNARGSLTDVELEHLRPFLTFFNHGQARGAARQADPGYTLYGPPVPANAGQWANPGDYGDLALVDLGTMLSAPGLVNGGWLDSLPPSSMLAFPDPPDLFGAGTTFIAEEKQPGAGGANGRQIEHVMSASALSSFSSILNQSLNSVPTLGVGWPIGIDIPAAVNIHQVPPTVLTVLNGVTPPSPPAAGLSTPSPDGLGSPNGLVMLNPAPGTGGKSLSPWQFNTLNDFLLPAQPGGTFTSAFALLNPLSSHQVICQSQLLPSQNSDVNSTTLPANGTIVTPDGTIPNHPEVAAGAVVLRIQGGAIAMLPPSGWGYINGQIATPSGPVGSEYITYSSISILNAATGQAVLYGVARGQTYPTIYGNLPSVAQPYFSDLIPASLPATGEATPVRPSITIFAAHELPPLGIASHGVVTIDSAATFTDRVGLQDAQHARRVVAQAVPQEQLLEERWLTQAEMHALIANRQGSLLTTFPTPYPRIGDDLPNDPDPAPPLSDTAGIGATADASVGLRPSTLRTLISSPFNATDWALPFSGLMSNFQSPITVSGINNSQTGNLPNVIYPTSLMTPEGLGLQSSFGPLSYGIIANDHGPLALTSAPTNTPILPRQFSMWIKPTVDLSGMRVTLAEMRMPIANAGLALTGAEGVPSVYNTAGITQTDQRVDPTSTSGPDTSQQNYWSLQYDALTTTAPPRLILCLGNASIEHTNNYGPLTPADDPTSYLMDDRSGDATTPGAIEPFLPLAPKRPMNRVEFHYVYTLAVNQWHLIQVTYTSDLPGGQSIMVDGLVGTDITTAASFRGSMSMTEYGDHVTLPCMLLQSSLPYYPMDAVSPTSIASSFIPRIDMLSWTPQGNGLLDLLPARGYVRIGNEYISYDSLDSQGLINCRRGQRQDSDTNIQGGGVQPAQAWPAMPAHQANDIVVPGGYRLARGTGAILRGGCLLAPLPSAAGIPPVSVTTTDPAVPGMWSGDPNASFELWGSAAPSLAQDSPSGQSTTAIVPPSIYGVLVSDAITIRMQGAPSGLVWPLRGYAEVFDFATNSPGFPARVFYYDNTASGAPSTTQPFTNVQPVNATAAGFTLGHWPSPLIFNQPSTSPQPIVLMLSCELLAPPGVAATDPTRYSPGIANVGNPYPIQFYDQDEGRVEWLYYNYICAPPNSTGVPPNPTATPVANNPTFYLINYSGFSWYGPGATNNQRGIERTMGPYSIAGITQGSPYPASTLLPAFPAGSRVLPVQTGISFPVSNGASGCEVIRTGDVFTISPNAVSIGTYNVRVPGNDALGNAPTGPAKAQTWQAVVRYAAMDGYGFGNDPTQWLFGNQITSDTSNQWFAFTEEIPQIYTANYDFLSWPCWNGNELDPYNTGVAMLNGDIPGSTQPLTGTTGLLPFQNCFSSDPLLATDDRTFYIGSPDIRTTNNPAPASAQTINAVIDAVAAGVPSTQSNRSQVVYIAGSGSPAPWNPVAGQVWIAGNTLNDIVGVIIQADQGIFNQPYGLVLIGGEVFAYQRYTDPVSGQINPLAAQLIARGLLGSVATTHQSNEPVVMIPIGPVSTLSGTLLANYQGQLALNQTGFLDAPCLMISAPDGTSMEIIAAPRGLTAPWLRGLYNTSVPDLSGGNPWGPDPHTQLNPVVIGWWPRYPSALPNLESPLWQNLISQPAQPGASPSQANAMLRSRTYAWASFPIRYTDSVFPSASATLGSVTVLDSSYFNISALALSNGFDLHDSLGTEVPLSGPWGFNQAASFSSGQAKPFGSAFANPQFLSTATPPQLIPTDGAELRVLWRYSTPNNIQSTVQQSLGALATLANSAPMLGQTYLRCFAPAKILSVQSAR